MLRGSQQLPGRIVTWAGLAACNNERAVAVGDQGEQDHSSLCDAAEAAFRLVDQVAEGVVRLVNSTGEHRSACRRGCNSCCTVFVRVTRAEAISIALWLLAHERAERLERFRKQVALWRAAAGPEVARLEELVTNKSRQPAASGTRVAALCRGGPDLQPTKADVSFQCRRR